MRAAETVQVINRSITILDRELERRIAAVEERLHQQANLMDELERELDDLCDERLRRQLLGIVARYDDARESVKHELQGVLTRDLFDQLRTLAVDVRHDL